MDITHMTVPLEIQKLALEMRRDRVSSDILSITSCGSHSCGATVVEDAERLNPNVQPATPPTNPTP